MSTRLMDKEHIIKDQNNELLIKIDELENDIQGQIKDWRYKYAELSEQSRSELAELNKKYQYQMSDDVNIKFQKEEK